VSFEEHGEFGIDLPFHKVKGTYERLDGQTRSRPIPRCLL